MEGRTQLPGRDSPGNTRESRPVPGNPAPHAIRQRHTPVHKRVHRRVTLFPLPSDQEHTAACAVRCLHKRGHEMSDLNAEFFDRTITELPCPPPEVQPTVEPQSSRIFRTKIEKALIV